MRRQRKTRPLRWLLLIPGQAAVDLLGIFAAIRLDTAGLPAEAGQGHPAPVWTGLAMAVLGLATLVVCVLAIVMTVVRLIQQRSCAGSGLDRKENTDGTNGGI